MKNTENRLLKYRFTFTEILIASSIMLMITGAVFLFMSRSAQDSQQLSEKLDSIQQVRFNIVSLDNILKNAVELSVDPSLYKDQPYKTTELNFLNSRGEACILKANPDKNNILLENTLSGTTGIIASGVENAVFSVRSPFLADYSFTVADGALKKTAASTIFLENNRIFLLSFKELMNKTALGSSLKNPSFWQATHFSAQDSETGETYGCTEIKIPEWVNTLKGTLSFELESSQNAQTLQFAFDDDAHAGLMPVSKDMALSLFNDEQSLYYSGEFLNCTAGNAKIPSQNKISVKLSWNLFDAYGMTLTIDTQDSQESAVMLETTPPALAGRRLIFANNGYVIKNLKLRLGYNHPE